MRAKYVSVQVATGKGVADRWRAQYAKNGEWKDNDKARVHEALCKLGDEPAADEVNAVIGNQSWTYFFCDGCSTYVTRAVSIGENEPNSFCPTCIDEAHHILHEDDSR